MTDQSDAPERKERKEDGFYIGGTSLFFPLIASEKFKQGDIKLIELVTGKPWEQWIKLLGDHGLSHALTKQGFLAVAIQRARDATPEAVEAFIDDLPLMSGIELYFSPASRERAEKEADDSSPPAEETAS